MAANPAYLHDYEEHEAQPRRRSWAATVPYELLDHDAGVMDGAARPGYNGTRARANVAVPPAAATRATATLSYQPARATPALPEQEIWRPSPAVRSHGAPAQAALSRSNARLGIYAMLAAAAVVVLYVVVSTIVNWTQIRLDDMTYGRPRTTHLDAVVGHGDSAAQPSHFIALNLNRQISIIEIPAGDISKAVAISGPYLFGEGEDLTPVKLVLADLNGDALPDLLVDVKSEQMAYINENNSFRPITADEKAQLDQAQQGAGQ